MDKTAKKIISQALQIPLKDRAIIAERLISSLDTIADLDVEIAWQKKIQQRVMEVDKGDVVCIPWEVVQEQLRRNAIATS